MSFMFENLYSIATHSFIFITAICFITLKFTNFRYKTIWKELICFAVMLIYVFLEMYVLKIENDPFYFMPGNDIQEIVGLAYPLFLTIYLCFIMVYFNIFYLIKFRTKRCHALIKLCAEQTTSHKIWHNNI